MGSAETDCLDPVPAHLPTSSSFPPTPQCAPKMSLPAGQHVQLQAEKNIYRSARGSSFGDHLTHPAVLYVGKLRPKQVKCVAYSHTASWKQSSVRISQSDTQLHRDKRECLGRQDRLGMFQSRHPVCAPRVASEYMCYTSESEAVASQPSSSMECLPP